MQFIYFIITDGPINKRGRHDPQNNGAFILLKDIRRDINK